MRSRIVTTVRRRSLTLVVLPILIALAAVGCSSGTGPDATETSASTATSAGAFPVSINHQFGTATIPSAPQRVLTIGFNEQDFALALGVEPVGVREFLGYDAPKRPWAPESVRGNAVPTVGAEELALENVAALKPDLILGINSYIDKATYDKLAVIAPTVAQSGDVALGATTWADQTMTTGKALGQEAAAQQLVDQTRAAFTSAVEKNPSFAGKSAAFALGSTAEGSYSLGADDYRTGWLTDLGFMVPKKSAEVSFEQLDVFDADVLIAEGVEDAAVENPLFARLPPVREGRFLRLGAFDDDFAAALGFNSPLSIPYLLDIAVPRLAAATDGDPATVPEPYPA